MNTKSITPSWFDLKFLRLIRRQLKVFAWFYVFGALALILTHDIQSRLPFWAKELALKQRETLGLDFSTTTTFLGAALGIILFRTVSRVLFFYPARVLQKLLREELVLSLEMSSPYSYKDQPKGQLLQYLMGDIDQIRALIGFVGLQGANFFIAFAILIPKLIHFHARLIFALIPMFVAFVIFTLVVSLNRRHFKENQKLAGDLQNFIIESLAGKKTITTFQVESTFISLFKGNSLKELASFYRSSFAISIFMPLIAFGIGLSLVLGAYFIKKDQLGAQGLIVFSGFVFLFMEPMGYLSWLGVVISRSSAAWERLFKFNQKLKNSNSELQSLIDLNRDLKLNLNQNHFSIPFWNVPPLQINIANGKWKIIVGKTGHGKSELLFKLAEVAKQKKMNVSLVTQTPYLFNDTISANIFLGKTPRLDELNDAYELLVLFSLNHLADNQNSLLELEVGEHGKRLSGGEAKRLALVRSLMSGAELLIWDDPFSSVDVVLERDITARLQSHYFLKDKAVVLSGHRLTTVKNCQELIFIDKELGIVAGGEPRELLKNNRDIYEYFKLQMV